MDCSRDLGKIEQNFRKQLVHGIPHLKCASGECCHTLACTPWHQTKLQTLD